MPFSTALRALLAAALLRLRHLMPQQHPHPLPQLVQLMQAAKWRREVLELSQLAALLPLDAQARTLLVEQTLEALHRVESMPSPRNSASRAQTVRSIRSRRRRR